MTVHLRRWVGAPGRQKFLRYSLVSIFNVVLGQGILALAFAGFHWTARSSNVLATAIATGPAYYISRTWVWRGQGRSHLLKEVLPFWVLAFVGLGLSTWLAGVAAHQATRFTSVRLEQTGVVMAGTLLAYGSVWVLRFFVLDKVLFAHHAPSEPLPIRRVDVEA